VDARAEHVGIHLMSGTAGGGYLRPMTTGLGTDRTFIVECFMPSVDPAAVEVASRRAGDAAAALRREGRVIEYLGAMLVPQDEVVFHRLRAPSPTIVHEAAEQAALPFERIVESVSVVPAAPADPRPAS
jgi:hypothetical protein